MNRLVTSLILGLFCTACSSTDPKVVEQAKPAPTGLGAQTLAQGECGLFLWTLTEPRQFVFFAKSESDAALAAIGAEEMSLKKIAVSGDIFGQFMTEQSYRDINGGGDVRVLLTPGELLEKGQRTQSARITYTDAKGWETIVPVAGVRACQTDE